MNLAKNNYSPIDSERGSSHSVKRKIFKPMIILSELSNEARSSCRNEIINVNKGGIQGGHKTYISSSANNTQKIQASQKGEYVINENLANLSKPAIIFHNNGSSGGGGSHSNKLYSNKIATAIAWNEESIREENEFAENDEGITTHKNLESFNLKRINEKMVAKPQPYMND